MPFSAKRCAYSDMPSFSSQSAISCIAAPCPAHVRASGRANLSDTSRRAKPTQTVRRAGPRPEEPPNCPVNARRLGLLPGRRYCLMIERHLLHLRRKVSQCQTCRTIKTKKIQSMPNLPMLR